MVAKVSTRTVPLFLLLALTSCGQDRSDHLYTASAFVTGQDERYRADGIAACLPLVLVKVSGDPTLLSDPRVPALASTAGAFVASIEYRDRMAGIPIGDEQGTRDRPYDLSVKFKQSQIDVALRSLGREPWRGQRPVVAAFIGVNNHGRTYVLSNDQDLGLDQRAALTEAADAVGVPLELPTASRVAADGVTAQALLNGQLSAALAAKTIGSGAVLIGSMTWNTGDIGWRADWRFNWNHIPHHWTIRDVNFDEAFRIAMRGAARIMSGHGEPASADEPQ